MVPCHGHYIDAAPHSFKHIFLFKLPSIHAAIICFTLPFLSCLASLGSTLTMWSSTVKRKGTRASSGFLDTLSRPTCQPIFMQSVCTILIYLSIWHVKKKRIYTYTQRKVAHVAATVGTVPQLQPVTIIFSTISHTPWT